MTDSEIVNFLESLRLRTHQRPSFHPSGCSVDHLSTDIYLSHSGASVYVRAPDGVRCVARGDGSTLRDAVQTAYNEFVSDNKENTEQNPCESVSIRGLKNAESLPE